MINLLVEKCSLCRMINVVDWKLKKKFYNNKNITISFLKLKRWYAIKNRLYNHKKKIDNLSCMEKKS